MDKNNFYFILTKNISLNFQLSNLFFILIFSILTFTSPTEIQMTKNAQKFLIMDIYIEKEIDSSSMFDLFDNINPVFGKIKLGSNEQELIMQIRLDTYSTIISEDKEISKNFKLFDKNSSETYYQIEEKTFTSKEFFQGILSLDLLTLTQKDKVENFHFFYALKLSEKGNLLPSGIIGLDLKKRYTLYGPKFHTHSINFVDQLENNQIIDEYGVTIILDKENKKRGKLFFGPDLDDIFDDFKNCLKTRVKAGDTTNENFIRWGFIFDSIKVDGKELGGSKNVELKLDTDFFLSTDAYSAKIMNLFFNDLIKKNICSLENLTISYLKYIKCNEKVLKELEKFPVLSFIGTDVSFDTFHLDFTYKDLFENVNGVIYFKVIIAIPNSENMVVSSEWKFGKLFFRKYVVTLDRRRKTVTFYTRTNLENIYNTVNNDIIKNKEISNKKNVKKSIIQVYSYGIMFIIILSLSLIFASIIIGLNKRKLIKKKEKEKETDNGEEMTYYSVED